MMEKGKVNISERDNEWRKKKNITYRTKPHTQEKCLITNHNMFVRAMYLSHH